MHESVTIEDLELARARLAGVVKPTPLIQSATLSRMLGAEVCLKPENLQKTGSFKIRGAYNRIAALSPTEAARGTVAASAGNHGQALAWAASRARPGGASRAAPTASPQAAWLPGGYPAPGYRRGSGLDRPPRPG